MGKQYVKVYGGGKVSIPASFRAALNLAEGDSLIASLENDAIVFRSANSGLRAAQRRMRELNPERRSLVDELIADRRREAADE